MSKYIQTNWFTFSLSIKQKIEKINFFLSSHFSTIFYAFTASPPSAKWTKKIEGRGITRVASETHELGINLWHRPATRLVIGKRGMMSNA